MGCLTHPHHTHLTAQSLSSNLPLPAPGLPCPALSCTGYSLPLEGFLYRRPKGKLRLLMDLSTSFDDVWVEQLQTRVVLPEGALNIKPSVRPGCWDELYHCSLIGWLL